MNSIQLPIENIPASMEIHIIAPFLRLNGGDWHAIDLFEIYKKTHKVRLWSPGDFHLDLSKNYPIERINSYQEKSPHEGVLIISGARTEIGIWYAKSRFSKVVMIHNLLSPGVLYQALHQLQQVQTPVEIIYVSNLVKRYAGLPGKVIHHMPTIDRFNPLTKRYSPDRFTVGRVSTDMLAKHHHSDIWVYRALAQEDIPIRIIGGTCLSPWLGNEPNVSLQPTIAQQDLPLAYKELDCFYYRVPSSVKDPFPLVVLEAMMAGLPVVCHRDIGSIEIIEHGVNGFIFDTPEQALNIIYTLKKNANLREKIGICASQSLLKN